MDLLSLDAIIKKISDGDTSVFVVIFGVVLSNVLTALVTRSNSKDKKNSDVMKETMKRQSEIDEQQKQLVNSLRDEIDRIQEEMRETKEESRLQKQDNREVNEKNRELLSKIGQLELELDRSRHEYDILEEKCSEK